MASVWVLLGLDLSFLYYWDIWQMCTLVGAQKAKLTHSLWLQEWSNQTYKAAARDLTTKAVWFISLAALLYLSVSPKTTVITVTLRPRPKTEIASMPSSILHAISAFLVPTVSSTPGASCPSPSPPLSLKFALIIHLFHRKPLFTQGQPGHLVPSVPFLLIMGTCTGPSPPPTQPLARHVWLTWTALGPQPFLVAHVCLYFFPQSTFRHLSRPFCTL